jgi:hypothetical protein
MSERPGEPHPDAEPPGSRGSGESLLRDGLRGIALVTAATAGLAAIAAVIALVVAALY